MTDATADVVNTADIHSHRVLLKIQRPVYKLIIQNGMFSVAVQDVRPSQVMNKRVCDVFQSMIFINYDHY